MPFPSPRLCDSAQKRPKGLQAIRHGSQIAANCFLAAVSLGKLFRNWRVQKAFKRRGGDSVSQTGFIIERLSGKALQYTSAPSSSLETVLQVTLPPAKSWEQKSTTVCHLMVWVECKWVVYKNNQRWLSAESLTNNTAALKNNPSGCNKNRWHASLPVQQIVWHRRGGRSWGENTFSLYWRAHRHPRIEGRKQKQLKCCTELWWMASKSWLLWNTGLKVIHGSMSPPLSLWTMNKRMDQSQCPLSLSPSAPQPRSPTWSCARGWSRRWASGGAVRCCGAGTAPSPPPRSARSTWPVRRQMWT